MARVTNEDCAIKTDGLFELVVLASQRAKDIHSGATITVPRENDKNTVLALKEIASGNITISDLRERFINSLHPQSALSTLDNEYETVDKDIKEEFVADDSDFGLSEDQMSMEDDSSEFFEDIEILRFLELNIKIKMIKIKSFISILLFAFNFGAISVFGQSNGFEVLKNLEIMDQIYEHLDLYFVDEPQNGKI
jgi:DNA-directed RNA polymerase subunit omega